MLAFPYGPTMLLIFLPVTSLGWLLDNVFNSSYFIILGFQLTLLIADIFLLLTLIQQFYSYRKQLIVYYWLSPLIFYITYWHGQIDLLPVVFLFYSVGLLKKGNYKLGGLFLALSVTAKYSMLIGIPFICVYLWLNKNIKGGFWETIAPFSILSLIIMAPFLLSPGFWEMVIYNRESSRLFSL